MSKLFIALVLIAFPVACGKINQKPSDAVGGDSGSTTGLGGIKALIKINGSTIAQLVSWTDRAREVFVWIPSLQKYSFINLDTGLYTSNSFDGTNEFYFSSPDCSGAPIATGTHHLGEKNRSVLYHEPTSSYFLVTGDQTTLNYNSFHYGGSSGTCSRRAGTTLAAYALTPTTQPYDFASHAPLAISYTDWAGNSSTIIGLDDKGVIKSDGTAIARIISWTDDARMVIVYIPSKDKYAAINLSTGIYTSRAIDGSTLFYYSSLDCSGSPVAVDDKHTGEKNKAIVYHDPTDTYFLVTGDKSTVNYNSSKWGGTGSCATVPGTAQSAFAVTLSSRPYNFEAIAPLTISYD